MSLNRSLALSFKRMMIEDGKSQQEVFEKIDELTTLDNQSKEELKKILNNVKSSACFNWPLEIRGRG